MDKDSLVERLTEKQRRLLETVDVWNGVTKAALPGDAWRRMDALADRGLVQRQAGAIYSITDAGRQALKETSRG